MVYGFPLVSQQENWITHFFGLLGKLWVQLFTHFKTGFWWELGFTHPGGWSSTFHGCSGLLGILLWYFGEEGERKIRNGNLDREDQAPCMPWPLTKWQDLFCSRPLPYKIRRDCRCDKCARVLICYRTQASLAKKASRRDPHYTSVSCLPLKKPKSWRSKILHRLPAVLSSVLSWVCARNAERLRSYWFPWVTAVMCDSSQQRARHYRKLDMR